MNVALSSPRANVNWNRRRTIVRGSIDQAALRERPCPNANLLPGGRFAAACWPLRTFVLEAYDVLPNQISGGPAWFYSDPWDVSAKAKGFAGEIPTPQFRSMLRELIKERFHLILREDTKLLPGLTLVVSAHGPKLTPNTGASFQFDLEPGATLTCKKVTTAQFASWLKGFTGAGRVVIDKTGLRGEYDFTLKWTPEPLATRHVEDRSNPASSTPSLFTALQEQLGLRVKSQRVPTKTLVIEAADRPSDN